MRAELRSLHTPDTSHTTLGDFAPGNPEHFALHVQALVGPSDGPGEESFEFEVCTPSWIADPARRPKGFEFVRHTIVVDQWDADAVERAIADLCRRTEGETWADVGTSLSRYGRWEFEE